jgi:hypothetical protein
MTEMIGQVLRASTEGFTCGTRSTDVNRPSFGAFVKSEGNDAVIVIGLITAIRIDDDPLVRQLIMAGNMQTGTLRDQRENRMIPVEIDVVNVGYVEDGRIYHNLPPRPPLSLDPVDFCTNDEVVAFTERKTDFVRLVLRSGGVGNTNELLAAALRRAALARPPELRMEFLVQAGRQLTSLLSHDLSGLQHVLLLLRDS